MKMNDVFPNKYLKAEDLDGDLTVTIKSVVKEHFQAQPGRAAEDKAVAYFSETEKGLVINKTNFKLIAEALGEEDSDNWVGKKVTLTVVDVDSFGDVVAAIRVKKAKLDRAALMTRYQVLFTRAQELKIGGLENFKLPDNIDEATIIDCGKQLKSMIEAAETF